MDVDVILKDLERLGNPANVEGMRRFGIRAPKVYGVTLRSAEVIRKIDSKAARWVAAAALRELTSPAAQKRLKNRPAKSQ